jgi:hypothetical protein
MQQLSKRSYQLTPKLTSTQLQKQRNEKNKQEKCMHTLQLLSYPAAFSSSARAHMQGQSGSVPLSGASSKGRLPCYILTPAQYPP